MKIVFLCCFTQLMALSWAYGQITFISSQESIGSEVNSKYFEERIVMSPDGHSLFFTRANAPDNIGGVRDNGDIWMTRLSESGQWSAPENVGRPLNNEDRNEVVGFFNNGNGVILNYHYDHNRTTNHGVSLSLYRNGKWTKPKNVEIKYFQNRSHHQTATLSRDGRILILSLMSYGTYGVEDLYVCELQANGLWSDPRNLGSTINTSFQEITPFLADDGQTLFFATNGRGGHGSLDIFMTQRLDSTWRKWSEPQNLGTAVNTPGAEYSFRYHTGNDYAYFVSTQNSDGYGDIKRVKVKNEEILETPDSLANPAISVLPDSISFITAVRSAANGKVIPSSISITYPGADEAMNLENDGVSAYELKIPMNQEVQLSVAASDHIPYDTLVKFTQLLTPRWNEDFSLNPLEVGSTFTLKNILFEQGTANLVSGSEAGLEQVVKLMQQHDEIAIELSGHTDNRGIHALNVKLSEERVEAVMQYLIEHGIAQDRLSGTGYGGSQPIASNETEETRRLNRRVEFTIVKR